MLIMVGPQKYCNAWRGNDESSHRDRCPGRAHASAACHTRFYTAAVVSFVYLCNYNSTHPTAPSFANYWRLQWTVEFDTRGHSKWLTWSGEGSLGPLVLKHVQHSHGHAHHARDTLQFRVCMNVPSFRNLQAKLLQSFIGCNKQHQVLATDSRCFCMASIIKIVDHIAVVINQYSHSVWSYVFNL